MLGEPFPVSLTGKLLPALLVPTQRLPPSGSPPCSWLHLLGGADHFFLTGAGAPRGQARSYSRGIQGASPANLCGCPEPVPTSPTPGFFLCELHFPFLLCFSLLLPLLPANLSVSSPCPSSFFPSLQTSPLPPAPFLPPPSPCASASGPAAAVPPAACRGAATPAGPHRRGSSCGVRWEEAAWKPRPVDLQVGVGARGASFPCRGPSFGAGLGGPGRAPPAPEHPFPIRVRCTEGGRRPQPTKGVGMTKRRGLRGPGATWPSAGPGHGRETGATNPFWRRCHKCFGEFI